ncbi:MAG: sigma-70 family RNA polymerase sigma factor [Planctomycetes bacterium]|nr:sigma-70 family RNA polymerase sigma factor [Planctomycetota bacterium]
MRTAAKNLAETNDGELLASFVEDRQPEAFAEIVRRHGPLVLGVCRSVLGNSHDAEDAAQAVFLALFHKAASLKRHPALAGWLHQVAWYVAAHEKRAITTRMRHEQEATAMKQRESQTISESIAPDLLHEGLSRLPEKYRLPIIMHHLEGHSQEEVASLLGEKSGTIMSRLNHGRQMLRDRLAKTGAAVSVAALTTAMAGQATAGVSSAFVASVTKMAALSLTAKAAAAGAASAKVLALSKGALSMLFMAKVKVAAMLTAAVCLVGATAAGTYVAVAAGPGNRTVKPPAPAAAPAIPPKTDLPRVETVAPANPSTPPASSGQATIIEITDKVLVKDTIRLGVNTGDDGVFSGCIAVKKRIQDNFEGTIYRQCHWGIGDENGLASWFGTTPEWNKLLMDGTYTVLSGPSKQTSGKLKAVGEKTIKNQGKDQKLVYFELDKPITKAEKCGLLVENLDRTREGQFRPQDERYIAKGSEIAILDDKDKAPDSFGCAALFMKSEGGPAFVGYRTFVQRFADNNGMWNVEFWAKTKQGSPKFTVTFCAGPNVNSPLASQPVELTNEWKKHKVSLKVAGYPEPTGNNDNEQPFLGACGAIVLQSEGGQVLVDDVEAWQEGDKNPTAFRDEYVDAIKLFSPGSLRFIQMGGNSMENTIMPPNKAYSCSFRRGDAPGPYCMRQKNPYGMNEFLALCEYVGAEPWYCVPGTLHLDEAKALMEYLGGPADSKYGKIRADLGHAKPWTETFRQIHIEFGNEAWNNAPPFYE